MFGKEDPRTPRGLAGELDGRLDGLGAGVAEEDPVDVVGTVGDQLLGQQAGQERAIHLDHVREIEFDGLMECGLQRRMTSPEGVHAETRKEVEIPLALGVEEVGPLPPDVEAIESDRLEHPRQLVVQVLLMQCVVLAVARP